MAHVREGPLGHSDEPHAVVDTARSEPALGDLEAASFAKQQVRRGHADVFEEHFAVPVRRLIVAEDGQHADDLHAGRIHRDDYHGLLLVAGRGGVGLAHENGDFAARIARAGGPPFAAVQDIIVAIADDAGFNVGGVR